MEAKKGVSGGVSGPGSQRGIDQKTLLMRSEGGEGSVSRHWERINLSQIDADEKKEFQQHRPCSDDTDSQPLP